MSVDSQRRTFAFLQVGGETFDWFEDYSVHSDILQPSGSFSFHAPVLPTGRAASAGELDDRGLRPGERFELFVQTPEMRGPALQMTGSIDDVALEETLAGSKLTVTGRDHMSAIVDCDVPPVLSVENVTFADVVSKLLTQRLPGQSEPFFRPGDVLVDNDANRNLLTANGKGKPSQASASGAQKRYNEASKVHAALVAEAESSVAGASNLYGLANSPIADTEAYSAALAASLSASEQKLAKLRAEAFAAGSAAGQLGGLLVDQARPHPGETVYQFLHRHAVRFGLLIWGTADGKIVFGRPKYDQAPAYRFACVEGPAGRWNNAILSRKRTIKGVPSEVHVYGHTAGGDAMRSTVHAVAKNQAVIDRGVYRVLTVHDNQARTNKQAEARAKYELSLRQQASDVVMVQTHGHASDAGVVYSVDTTASVEWTKGNLAGDWYVAARTFTASRSAGRRTQIELVPKGSIAIEPTAGGA